MQLTRCPSCHARIDLTSCVEDEAGRELLAVVAKLTPRLAAPLLSYIGLFRPEKQDLRNSRALALLQDTLALCSDQYLLTAALEQTVQQLQQTRQTSTRTDPLKNHNYLKKVMTGIAERAGQSVQPAADNTAPATPTQIDEAVTKQHNDAAYRKQMRELGFEVVQDGQLMRRGGETT